MKSEHLNLTKAVDQLNQRGLSGLIIYSDGISSILRPSYLHYFSEFKPMGPRNAAVLSRSGKVALLVEPFWDAHRACEKTWIRDVRGSSHFVRDLVETLEEFNIKGPVGAAGIREMKEDV